MMADQTRRNGPANEEGFALSPASIEKIMKTFEKEE